MKSRASGCAIRSPAVLGDRGEQIHQVGLRRRDRRSTWPAAPARQEELELAVEVLVQHRLRAAGLAGDLAHARTVVAALGEEAAPDLEACGAALLAGHAAPAGDGGVGGGGRTGQPSK